MPNHVSNAGDWSPAKEKVSLVNNTGKPLKHPITGEMIGVDEPYIYEGPDRAALEQYAKDNPDRIVSQPFWKNPEMIHMVRTVHQQTMEQYMKDQGFDEKATTEQFEKKMKEVNLHKAPARKPSNKFRSGGANTAGGGSISGDFGDKADAMAKITK